MKNYFSKVERTSKLSLLMLFAFALVFTFASCNKDDDDDNTPNTSQPFPGLKIGNEWRYEQISSYPDEDIYIDTNGIRIVEKMSHPTDKDIDVYLAIDDENDVPFHFLNYHKRLRAILFGEDENVENFPLLYWNTHIGHTGSKDTILEEYDAYYHTTIKVEVLSLNENVSVPAGTFQCVKLRVTETYTQEDDDGQNEGNYQDVLYFSRQFGLIKSESKNISKGYSKDAEDGGEYETTSTLKLLNKNF